jgi:transposase
MSDPEALCPPPLTRRRRERLVRDSSRLRKRCRHFPAAAGGAGRPGLIPTVVLPTVACVLIGWYLPRASTADPNGPPRCPSRSETTTP